VLLSLASLSLAGQEHGRDHPISGPRGNATLTHLAPMIGERVGQGRKPASEAPVRLRRPRLHQPRVWVPDDRRI
jgi:hypothetical protein